MKLIHPKTRPFPRVQGERERYDLKILKVAAAANLVFQAYHLNQSQALLIVGYFGDLHLGDNPLKEEGNSLRGCASELANTRKALLEIATLEKQKEEKNV